MRYLNFCYVFLTSVWRWYQNITRTSTIPCNCCLYYRPNAFTRYYIYSLSVNYQQVIDFKSVNPLTPGASYRNRIFGCIWGFSAWIYMDQIISSWPNRAFELWQHVFLSTSIAFNDIIARACAEIKISRELVTSTYVSRVFGFLNIFSPFLFLLFFSFCCSNWPSTELASNLKTSKKALLRQAVFTLE